MYYLGLGGVMVNKGKAFELYEASTQKGIAHGYFNLGSKKTALAPPLPATVLTTFLLRFL